MDRLCMEQKLYITKLIPVKKQNLKICQDKTNKSHHAIATATTFTLTCHGKVAEGETLS